MKTFLLLFLFITSLLATDLASTYRKTNQEIDRLAPQLSPEDKVTLYYLIMSTRSKILAHTPYDTIKKQTLKIISSLHESKSNISSQEIENLHTLYIALINTSIKPKEVKKEIVLKHTLTSQIVITIISLSLGLFLGLILSIFLFNKKKLYSQQNDKSIQIINELENKNRDLEKQISTIKEEPYSDVKLETFETTDSTLVEQNSKLQATITNLKTKYNTLTQEQATEIQHLNEYVASLKNELAKHESL